ncbi:MAG: YdcH family protein, partial [Rhizobium sp.]|nr:YdcH family protein [Rhizobium sp.]
RSETEVEPVGDVEMETMRKKRMVLKDEIYGMLTKA